MLWHLSREPNGKIPHRQTGPPWCKVSNHCPQTDISKSQKSPPLRRFSEDFQAATLANQTTLWVLSPNLRSILYERSKWKEKARAPHLFSFLWELYKCLINKKGGWWRKIAICLIFEMLSLWNSGFLFEIFGGFMFHQRILAEANGSVFMLAFWWEY